MIEPSVRKVLLTAPQPLSGMLGDRVFLGAASQDCRLPRVVLSVISQTFPHTHDGDAGYRTGRIQVACLGPTYQAAHELAEEVRRRLDQYDGFGVTAQVEMELEVAEAEDIEREPYEGQGEGTYGVSLTCRFIYEQHT